MLAIEQLSSQPFACNAGVRITSTLVTYTVRDDVVSFVTDYLIITVMLYGFLFFFNDVASNAEYIASDDW